MAERVVTMHAQERDYYAPPLAYFERLERDPLLAQWRRGAVRWFSKVGGGEAVRQSNALGRTVLSLSL